MIVRLWGWVLALLCLAANGRALSIDARRLVAGADLRYHEPLGRIEEGLPIGNGVMGTLLWTSASALHVQINRVDVFGCGAATNSFPERHTDLCGGCGFVDINFASAREAAVFAGAEAPQHLSCYEGLAGIDGQGIKTRALAAMGHDAIAVEIADARPAPAAVSVALRMLRPPLVKNLAHTATSKIELRDGALVLIQSFREGDYYCGSAVAVGISGRPAAARLNGEREARLVAEPGGSGPFTVLIASAASFDPAADLGAAAIGQLRAAAAEGFEKLLEANRKWWADFWSRSLVRLHSADGVADHVAANYHYYLYVMASCSRGKFPAKFNGMLWTNTDDKRSWGGQYWGANQECLYQALLAANHAELLDPMFDMYSGALDSFALAARQQWDSQGIYIPETVAFDGLAALPDEIAREMRDLYLLRKPWSEASAKFHEYANNRPPHSSRWNWKVGGKWVDGKWETAERGAGPYGPTSHIFSRGAKIAYLYWQRYEYTGDTAWLRERAWPMLRGVAEFYRHYPNLKKESDGLYHIYYVNSNEPLWGGRDTDEEIASMRAILPVAIRASEILGVDEKMRPRWRELFEHLPPLPASDAAQASSLLAPGRQDARATFTMSLARYPAIPAGEGRDSLPRRSARAAAPAAGPTWIKGLEPIVQGRGGSLPDGNTTPMWILDLCTLESDPATLRLANATYDAWFPSGAAGRRVGVLSKLGAVAAALGRADDVKELLPAQLRVSEGPALANRLTLKEGAGTTCNEHAGRVADALHLALCQSVPAQPGGEPVIRVFPAWPRSWDADFKLACRGGFLVSSSMKNGTIERVEIESRIGGACRLRNPWGEGARVSLRRDGKQAETMSGGLLIFETRKGEEIVIVPKSARGAE